MRIVDSVLAGDRSTARHRMRRHLEAEHAWLRRRRSSRQLLDPTGVQLTGGGDKRGEGVAREVFRQVMNDAGIRIPWSITVESVEEAFASLDEGGASLPQSYPLEGAAAPGHWHHET